MQASPRLKRILFRILAELVTALSGTFIAFTILMVLGFSVNLLVISTVTEDPEYVQDSLGDMTDIPFVLIAGILVSTALFFLERASSRRFRASTAPAHR